MEKLQKQFTRERSLLYMCIWDNSERLGYSKWLGYEIKNSLFLKSGRENKVSIWFGENDIKRMNTAIVNKIDNYDILKLFKKETEKDWKFLKSFVFEEKEIDSILTLRKYYRKVVSWWGVMTLVFFVPDLEGIPSEIKNEAFLMRSQTEKYSAKFNSIFEDYFTKHYPQYKKYVHVLLPKEVFKLEKRNFTKHEIEDFEKRIVGYGYLNKKVYNLEDLNEGLLKENVYFNDRYKINSDKIKGSVAYRGKVKGEIQMILFKKDLKKFKKGKILVTDMTDPDFIPVIKKALAIITDEGGITCHAAITAREMKKPCIIGTKIATKVLKDGDLVEVDADNGIVRIIK
ncbi:MAG: Pyruvate, water dikinase [uncultured bacterium]|nr:MAG: Pyruvate, water dikinase [uncultured bacterium]